MKKLLVFILAVCLGVIVYYFIKEQVKAIRLSHFEDNILSATYLVTGISLLLLGRVKYLENKRKKP
jgi:VIT1/CCC1 family predicted Fe2+/Mn2+ transporter